MPAVASSNTAVSGLASPNARITPALTPIRVRRAARVSGGGSSPSRRMNIEHSVGMITSATKSELESVTMRVVGR